MAMVQVVGMPQLLKHLRGAQTGIPKQIRLTNLTIAREVAGQVAARAPVGTADQRDQHPGQLAASVKGRATQRAARVEIGKGLIYAKPIVFGWHRHHIEPNEFPYKVWDEQRVTIPAQYQAAIATAIREAHSL